MATSIVKAARMGRERAPLLTRLLPGESRKISSAEQETQVSNWIALAYEAALLMVSLLRIEWATRYRRRVLWQHAGANRDLLAAGGRA
jgi:hypothetical protein